MLEAGAGLTLLVAPALVIAFLFGSSEIETAIPIGRLAGAALVSLGVACWGARHDAGSAASRAIVNGLLIYNAAVVALIFSGNSGPVISMPMVRSRGPWSHGGLVLAIVAGQPVRRLRP